MSEWAERVSVAAQMDVSTPAGVHAFLLYVERDLETAWHPDDRAESLIVIATGKPCFTRAQARAMQAQMDRAYDTMLQAGSDIYAVSLQVWHEVHPNG